MFDGHLRDSRIFGLVGIFIFRKMLMVGNEPATSMRIFWRVSFGHTAVRRVRVRAVAVDEGDTAVIAAAAG